MKMDGFKYEIVVIDRHREELNHIIGFNTLKGITQEFDRITREIKGNKSSVACKASLYLVMDEEWYNQSN